jgi:hypothetical protein
MQCEHLIDEINECGNDATTEVILDCRLCRHITKFVLCEEHVQKPGDTLSRANEHVCR